MTPSIPPTSEIKSQSHNDVTTIDACNTGNAAAISNETITEELEHGRHKDRKQYKLPISSITLNNSTDLAEIWLEIEPYFQYNTAKVPHRSLVKQHKENYSVKGTRSETDIHLLLPEWLHEKLLCKTCCGYSFGDSYGVRYIGDLIRMFFRFIVEPVSGICVVVSTLTTDASIPEWIHYAGGAFYILFVPFLWIGHVKDTFESPSAHAMHEIDSEKLKWYLIITFVVTFICSPIYGIWALATLPADTTIDTNFGLKLGGYAFCIVSVPFWFYLCLPLYGLFRMKSWQALALCIAFLLGSAIHQGVVGELVWFPYLAVPGLLACVPFLVVIPTLLLVARCYKILQRRLGLPQLPKILTDYGIYLLYVFVVNFMAALVADRNLLQPTQVLLEDDLLYNGAVCFYVVSIFITIVFALSLALL